MKKIIFIAIACILGLIGCTQQQNDAIITTFESVAKKVKMEFAPDSRSKVFKFTLEKNGTEYILKGSTTEMQAKEALLAQLLKNNIQVTDSSYLLPSADLGDKIFGVATQSVINFRTDSEYSAESATQVMMGTPLRILETEGGWSRCITPEGYIAWVTSGSLAEMSKADFDNYTAAKKVIVTTKYTTVTKEPLETSLMVTDAVWGNIMLDLGIEENMQKVALADGREGYLPLSQVQPFDTWVAQRNPIAENIIATAKQFIGIPYMWGGTSIKAVDCSGFTKTVYFLNGLIIARDASQQCYTGTDVNINEYVNNNNYTLDAIKNLQKGDLIFFGRKTTSEKKEKISHVGIYIENGIFIHAATKVRINSLIPTDSTYYDGSTRLVRAQRIIGNQDTGKGIESIAKSGYLIK
ncbi:MAG: C40 family peptidase [Bacteroidales bacterium]